MKQRGDKNTGVRKPTPSRTGKGNHVTFLNLYIDMYSGTSLLRPPTGLGKGVLNGEVTILQGTNVPLFALLSTILGPNKRDHNSEVTLLTSEVTLLTSEVTLLTSEVTLLTSEVTLLTR